MIDTIRFIANRRSMSMFLSPQGFVLILYYFSIQNKLHKYLKLQKEKKIENLWTSIGAHIQLLKKKAPIDNIVKGSDRRPLQ